MRKETLSKKFVSLCVKPIKYLPKPNRFYVLILYLDLLLSGLILVSMYSYKSVLPVRLKSNGNFQLKVPSKRYPNFQDIVRVWSLVTKVASKVKVKFFQRRSSLPTCAAIMFHLNLRVPLFSNFGMCPSYFEVVKFQGNLVIRV